MGFIKEIRDMLFGPKVDYKELMEKGAAIIDVRTPAEFKSGHKKGSVNIPLQNIGSKIKNYKNKEVIVVCKSGMRASSAKRMFEQEGIKCYNAGAWQSLN